MLIQDAVTVGAFIHDYFYPSIRSNRVHRKVTNLDIVVRMMKISPTARNGRIS